MSVNKRVKLNIEKGEATMHLGEDYQRVVLLASNAFVKMADALNEFGSAAFTILYLMGQEKGNYDYLREGQALKQRGISFTKRQMLENIIRQLRITGWGAPKIQKYDEKRGILTISIENNPFTIVWKTGATQNRPTCHYFRGYWIGVVSDVWEKKVNCTETKCISLGDAYCEFEVTSTK